MNDMGIVGRVRGFETKSFRGGTVPMLKVEFYLGDIRRVPYYGPAGEDSKPVIGDYVFAVQDTAHPGRLKAIGTLDTKNAPVASEGERRLYSRDSSGDAQSIVWLKANGELELNSGVDYAVAFDRLKIAFDTLKADLNLFITAYNAHVHSSSGSGPTTIVGIPSVADVTPAKVATVRLP